MQKVAIEHDFRAKYMPIDKHMVFFELELKDKMNLKHDDFTLQVMQQGERQRAYRSKDPEVKFDMSPCNVWICSTNTFQTSRIVRWKASKQTSLHYGRVNGKSKLRKGKFLIGVDF